MIPRVVPIPSSRTPPGLIVWTVAPLPTMIMKMAPIMITTMLFTTGVHIGAAKWPRAFRIAPARLFMKSWPSVYVSF